jgi:Xaa-Pro aminopeptidase
MASATETAVLLPQALPAANAGNSSDRRVDIELKQAQVAELLQKIGCDGLLILEPENFVWLTSGANARGVLDPAELPGLYFTMEHRWILSSNVDSQRLFDEELDGLGFQLKEWPWHWGRQQLLNDLCQGRNVACDRAYNSFKTVDEELRGLRRRLTPYEQACCRAVGAIVSHAIEATCRTMSRDETEREIAGQISHRLLHRGAQPLAIEVAADGRSRVYRQCGFTSTPIKRYGAFTATACKYGLYVTASRSVSFGEPDAEFRKEHDAACKIAATYLASSWPDAVPRQVLSMGRNVYELTGFEHEWRLCQQGHLTGRRPVEMSLTPQTLELIPADCALTWRVSVGAAFSCDTFLITDKGPQLLTPTEMWPSKLIRVQGAEVYRPDVLAR